MKEKNDLQVLQDALQAMVRMHRDYADLMATVLTVIGSMDLDNLSVETWAFDENDYTSVVTWLMNSPVAESMQRKPHESWPRYATRLSKYVGWKMETDTLRRRYNSRLEQKRVADSKK